MSSKEEPSKAPAAVASAGADSNAAKNDASEADFLLFGSRPSHLFDDMRIAIDTLLTEEVASLPLLPRTLSPSQRQQYRDGNGSGGGEEEKPLTGEQKLIAKLRKVYKKNLDLAEAYSSRNIFTIQYYNKTKRRKIIEQILEAGEGKDGKSNDEKNNKEDDNDNNKKMALPPINFEHPPKGGMPSEEELNGKNKEILQTRQQIQHDKQRRVQLSRQLDKLTKASQQLKELRGALDKALESKKSNDGGPEGTLTMKELQESVAKAIEGHEELKVWNARAEEVIQLMDQIKDEREEGGGGLLSNRNASGLSKRVATREEDERERKRMLSEMGGGDTETPHGTKEEIASLLNKIRS